MLKYVILLDIVGFVFNYLFSYRSYHGGEMVMEAKILIVEDDQDISIIMQLYLEKQGFQVLAIDNGEKLIDVLKKWEPDLIILDIVLPYIDGLTLLKQIRQWCSVPILLVSGKRHVAHKLHGFKLGADDYIVKPFNPSELVARVVANLRRSRKFSQEINQGVLHCGSLVIDREQCVVRLEGNVISLIRKEYLLLVYMAERMNRVCSVEHLYDAIWGLEGTGNMKTVAVHISQLRKKIEQDVRNPKWIQTVKGLGYKLSDAYSGSKL